MKKGNMEKSILFYKFTPLADPTAIMLWQKSLCELLELHGRILISKHGINGALAGDIEAVKAYVKTTKKYDAFKDTDFKYSDGSKNDFPRMTIKVRDEIVSFNYPELKVNKAGVVNTGKHLSPQAVNDLVKEYGDDVVFFDGRNKYEAEIGKFKNAIIPNTETSKDFINELDSGKYDDLKNKKIITYCTGGIRCEILSSIMKDKGFDNVYQIKGGIVRYANKYKDQELWEGNLYTFDKRMVLRYSDKDLTTCSYCDNGTSNYINCDIDSCHKLFIICSDCKAKTKTCNECR